MSSRYDQVREIIRRELDPITAKLIEDALGDADRISIIRDAFLEGRDVEAVKLLRDLDPVGLRKLLPCGMEYRHPTLLIDQSCQISARPQMPFTPTHLLVARSCAAYFVINDIRVGNRPQTVQAGDLPAELFAADIPELTSSAVQTSSKEGSLSEGIPIWIRKSAEDRLPVRLDIPEVQVGESVIVTVTFIGGPAGSGAEGRFLAAWLGETRRH